MNEQDQEILNISKTLELLDQGRDASAVMSALPPEFHDQAMEYIDLAKWMETERESIPAPRAGLEKALAALVVPEKPVEAKKAARMPLSELIPAKPKTDAPPWVQRNIPIPKTTAAAPATDKTEIKTSEKPPISWSYFFGKNPDIASAVRKGSWKVWVPSGAIALLLLIIGVDKGFLQGAKPDIVAMNVPSDSAGTAPESVPMMAKNASVTVPASTARTVTPSAAPAPSSDGSVDDQMSALSSSADKEAAATSGSDSDLASSNADSLGTANNSYNESSI